MAKKEISRRDFIKGIAAGAASVATLGVLQGCEYALNNKKATATAINPVPVDTQAASGLTFTPGT